jgi:hypothetical protein
MYDLNLDNNQLQNNSIVNTVWHTYCVKKKYISNLKKLGMYSTYLLKESKNNSYNKLENLYVRTRKEPIIFFCRNIHNLIKKI